MAKVIYASDPHFKTNNEEISKNCKQVFVKGDLSSGETTEQIEKRKKDKINQSIIKSTIKSIPE